MSSDSTDLDGMLHGIGDRLVEATRVSLFHKEEAKRVGQRLEKMFEAERDSTDRDGLSALDTLKTEALVRLELLAQFHCHNARALIVEGYEGRNQERVCNSHQWGVDEGRIISAAILLAGVDCHARAVSN